MWDKEKYNIDSEKHRNASKQVSAGPEGPYLGSNEVMRTPIKLDTVRIAIC